MLLRKQKNMATTDLAMAVACEVSEPDDLLPVGLPVDDIIRHGDDIIKAGDSVKTQIHHFATNKSKAYTPAFEEIANKFGLKLDDAWNKALVPHKGQASERLS